MCFPSDSWVSTSVMSKWELKVMAKVHTLHVNEEQLTLPPPPLGLLDAKGAPHRPSPVIPPKEPKAPAVHSSRGELLELLKGNQLLTFAGDTT